MDYEECANVLSPIKVMKKKHHNHPSPENQTHVQEQPDHIR